MTESEKNDAEHVSSNDAHTDIGDSSSDRNPEELPERSFEGRPMSAEAAEKALVRRPRIGDSRPAPVDEHPKADVGPAADSPESAAGGATKSPGKRRRGGRGRGSGGGGAKTATGGSPSASGGNRAPKAGDAKSEGSGSTTH